GRAGARGGGDAVVLLRGAGALYPRSAAAPPARRARHQPALLLQLRHRWRRLWPFRPWWSLRQPDYVSAARKPPRRPHLRARGVGGVFLPRPPIQLGVSLARYALIGVGGCRPEFRQGTGEAIWSDSPQRQLRWRGPRLGQATDTPRPQAARDNRRRRALRSSPIASGWRTGSCRGASATVRPGSSATPIIACAAAARSSASNHLAHGIGCAIHVRSRDMRARRSFLLRAVAPSPARSFFPLACRSDPHLGAAW